MCTVLLPPGDNPIAVNKYINISVLTHGRNLEGGPSGSNAPLLQYFLYLRTVLDIARRGTNEKNGVRI